MNTHELKLQPKYFDYINLGTKCIELRLYDEKRQQINVGDKIVFKKEPELTETMEKEVVGLCRFNNFNELFNMFPIEMMADASMTKEGLKGDLETFYTPEKQEQYGVIGIVLK